MRLARRSLSFAAVALMSVGLMSPVAQAQTADDLDKQSSDWLAPYRDVDPITTPHPIDEFDELKTSFDADPAPSGQMMVTNDGSLHGFTVEEAQKAEDLEK